jgi:hypothetical protein
MDACQVTGGAGGSSYSLDEQAGKSGETLHLTVTSPAGVTDTELFFIMARSGTRTCGVGGRRRPLKSQRARETRLRLAAIEAAEERSTVRRGATTAIRARGGCLRRPTARRAARAAAARAPGPP